MTSSWRDWLRKATTAVLALVVRMAPDALADGERLIWTVGDEQLARLGQGRSLRVVSVLDAEQGT